MCLSIFLQNTLVIEAENADNEASLTREPGSVWEGWRSHHRSAMLRLGGSPDPCDVQSLSPACGREI